MTPKIAIVTGSNKGIGLAEVETLAKQLSPSEWTICLTSRDLNRGKAALKQLHDKGYSHICMHLLDIDNYESVTNFREHLRVKYPAGINILINNAAILYGEELGLSTPDHPTPYGVIAESTMKTNFFSTLNFCRQLFPLLAKDARVVNMSSFLSINALNSLTPELKKKFISTTDMKVLEAMIKQFVADVKSDDFAARGWPVNNAYNISKLAINVMTKIQVLELSNDPRNLVINCCCPGFVDTDMTVHKGTKTPMEGADTPCFCALLPNRSINGKFLTDRKVVEWEDA